MIWTLAISSHSVFRRLLRMQNNLGGKWIQENIGKSASQFLPGLLNKPWIMRWNKNNIVAPIFRHLIAGILVSKKGRTISDPALKGQWILCFSQYASVCLPPFPYAPDPFRRCRVCEEYLCPSGRHDRLPSIYWRPWGRGRRWDENQISQSISILFTLGNN